MKISLQGIVILDKEATNMYEKKKRGTKKNGSGLDICRRENMIKRISELGNNSYERPIWSDSIKKYMELLQRD